MAAMSDPEGADSSQDAPKRERPGGGVWVPKPGSLHALTFDVTGILIRSNSEVPWYERHAEWIKKHVQQRKCSVYSRFTEENEERCVCGHLKAEHDEEDSNKKWKKEVNTSTDPSEYYGTLLIKQLVRSTNDKAENDSSVTKAPDRVPTEESGHALEFLRVDEDIPMGDIKSLLFNVWNVNRPKWIISLMGTQDELFTRLSKAVVKRALKKLWDRADLCIVSDGLHNGVSEHLVGAKSLERITSIGCSSWGILGDHDVFKGMQEDEDGYRKMTYFLKQGTEAITGPKQIGTNVSHMFLVDNGTRQPYLCDLSTMSFRARLVASLAASEAGTEVEMGSGAIPAVAILHGGELSHLEGLKNHIQENIPVVIIKERGGIADVICTAFEESKPMSRGNRGRNSGGNGTVIDDTLKKKIKEGLVKQFGGRDTTDEHVQIVIQCLQRRDRITVVEGVFNLFQGIISAMTKSKSNEDLIALVDEYLPSPVYNRHTKDKIEKFVDSKTRMHQNVTDFETVQEILVEAMVHEKTECVEFLLDYGLVDITSVDLIALYSKTIADLPNNVARMFTETKDDMELRLIVEYIFKGWERKGVLKRFYGFLHCLKFTMDIKRLNKLRIFQLPDEDMKKTVVDIVKDSSTKAQVTSKITKILKECQAQTELSKAFRFVNEESGHEEATELETSTQEIPSKAWKGFDYTLHDTASETEKRLYDPIAVLMRRITYAYLPFSCFIDDGHMKHNIDDDLEVEEAYRRLFVWAVLSNRNSLALAFWKRGKDLVTASLAAGTIMDTIAQGTFNNKKKALREESSKFYRSHATGTLAACYRDDKEKTVHLVERNISTNCWNIDFLALAFEKQNNSIFISEGMAYYTYSKWMGDIPKKTSTWRIVVCAILPFLMWILIGTQPMKKTPNPTTIGGKYSSDPVDRESSPRVGICGRLGRFYSTPIVKVILNLIVYCVFLGLYAHLLLNKLEEDYKRRWEIPLLIWMSAFLLEEMIQVLQFAVERNEFIALNRGPNSGCLNRLKSAVWLLNKHIKIYYQDKWNMLDSLCIIGFIIGYTLRILPVFFNEYKEMHLFGYGRLCLSINFMFFFWRLLQACTPSKSIGPMLYMVFRMVTDLIPFLVIFFVAICSYAVASEAILHPPGRNIFDSPSFVFDFGKGFWQIFGELFLDEIKGVGEKCDGSCIPNAGRIWVPLMLAVYMIMTHVLLLNIVIALFNHIFEDVRQKADEIWAWQKCRLMVEYDRKPPLPLPFSILWRLGSLAKKLTFCILCIKRKDKRKGLEEDNSVNLREIRQHIDTTGEDTHDGESHEYYYYENIWDEIEEDPEGYGDPYEDGGGTVKSNNAVSGYEDPYQYLSADCEIESNDDIFAEGEQQLEDSLDVFERANAEFYMQTEQSKD
ncbi:uncharacterized protein LOC124152055 [Haliotis rufescens]|uniref:uncharacterized protein LOC124152055 n=1 Tax=Haliotis rufescens TaxID=6454 RepID=UPI00201FAF42|nr:uncharacterized protein LOC124152055 [Haliotis rufescens]